MEPLTQSFKYPLYILTTATTKIPHTLKLPRTFHIPLQHGYLGP